MDDLEFLAVIGPGLEAAHERYRDPKNRAKGPIQDCNPWDILEEEIGELIDERDKWDDGVGDKQATRHEAGDVILTACNLVRALGDVCQKK